MKIVLKVHKRKKRKIALFVVHSVIAEILQNRPRLFNQSARYRPERLIAHSTQPRTVMDTQIHISIKQ